jgi:UDP:flavonoid glycosyltransferase YjiC (YdhE family)
VPPLREAIQRVLDDPSYRQSATRIAAELASTATLDTVVASLLSQASEG